MTTEVNPLLRWTGHPLIDAGVAALTAFAKKSQPEAVTEDDLWEFVDFAQQHYLTEDLKKSVIIVFTLNSFLNPSFKEDEKKREQIREAVSAFARKSDGRLPACVYCGRPGCQILHRDHVPMLSGRGVANFYPAGESGLVICGSCQTALHGLTLGAPRCSGKVLVVQADDPRVTFRLVRKWVGDTRRFLQISEAGGDVPSISAPQTRLIEALIQSERETAVQEAASGLVAYHLSNSGQGPGIEIYQLPSSVVRFLRRARSQRTAHAWGEIERRAWQPVKGGTTAADVSDDERLQYRNYLYDDLFRLPDDAGRFIRIYFLRKAFGLVRSNDLRADYSVTREADIVSWDLVTLFLEEVLSMEHGRIEAIRSLADRLAGEIDADNDQRLFRNLYQVRDYRSARRVLLSASFRRLRRNEEPVLSFDEYLQIFEEGEELARVDWRLAWDLMLIRLIEQLYSRNREMLNQVASEVASEESDEELDSVTA